MLTERLQKELEETYAKGLRRTVDGLRFKTAVRAEDEKAKNILCLQAITTLGLPMRRRYSWLRQKRYAGERAARAAALQQARRLKPANWKRTGGI